VRNVNKKLAVSGLSGLTSRGSDSLITSNVKVRFMNNKRFNADQIKVVTRTAPCIDGIVNMTSARHRITSNTNGVQRVVNCSNT